jgi:hypothetical protein
MKLFYLATPYSSSDPEMIEHRYKMACSITAQLMKEGFHVLSPIAHSHAIAVGNDMPKEFEFWKVHCLAILSKCDGMIVIMEDGWKESVGVQAEIAYCQQFGKPICYLCNNNHKLEEKEIDFLTLWSDAI